MMTPEQMTDRSTEILKQLSGIDTGDVISIIATALQMAICYGARTKDDAIDMISCIMADANNDIPRQYDLVQASRLLHKNVDKGERLQ